MDTFYELDEIITDLIQANSTAQLVTTGIVYSPHAFVPKDADNAFILLERKYKDILDQLTALQSKVREEATK